MYNNSTHIHFLKFSFLTAICGTVFLSFITGFITFITTEIMLFRKPCYSVENIGM